jgi:type II restriction enzyme
MFFITAINVDYPFGLTSKEAVEQIEEYRLLTRTQKQSLIDSIKTMLVPMKFKGTKPDKRDFHNWKNESQQVFSLLDQTAYFESADEQLIMKQKSGKFKEISSQLNRSVKEKERYFDEHDVERTIGYELHHVVPLSWSENINHFKLLDTWKNMLYVDGYNHSILTQKRIKNIIMKHKRRDIILKDHFEDCMVLKYVKNVIYNPENITLMEEYNNTLLVSVK